MAKRSLKDYLNSLSEKEIVLRADRAIISDSDDENKLKKSSPVRDDYIGAVVHASNPNIPRPADYMIVHWIGSVEPTNAIDNDLWIDIS